MKKFVAPFFAVCLIAAIAYVWLAPQSVKQKLPVFELSSLEGAAISEATLIGKPSLITFWATTCVTCIAEIPDLVSLHKEYGTQGFKVLAIAMDYDPFEQIVNLRNTRQLPYIVAHDSSGAVAQQFGNIRLTPTNILVAPDGTILYQKIGDLDVPLIRQHIESFL